MAAPKVRFTTGGTVQAGGGVYLKRSSDEELLQACQAGVFTYVLTSRQMGKSSLMTHAAEQLRSLQIQPLIIDLQAIGIQVTADQWYLGLLAAMEGQLMLDTDILDWWGNHQHLGLTQRFTTFFEQVLLKEISDRIVIFVDEIDTVLSVDFADDFFIAIRYFHQNRAQNPDLYRLSFVLLGVAAPGDLIRNQQRTPFNIGQPIDLRGFTVAEVQPLGAGLAQLLGISEPQALAVLEAVLHWTGGQPFLTQKVCQFMTATDSRPAPGEELAWVSALVQSKIIDRWEAQDTPPHLSTIRDRLTRSKEKTARLLGLYQNLLEQGDLPADDRPEQVELRLTGLVVKRDGRLQVFNGIYQSVFNRSWVIQALRDLRPYGDAIQEWLSSGRQDESRLLRGQALQEARQWAEGKSLGDSDRLFLDASQEIERREVELRFEAEREANRILTAARDEAEAEKDAANQELAKTKERTRRWATWGTTTGIIAALSLTGAITWAGIQTETARKNAANRIEIAQQDAEQKIKIADQQAKETIDTATAQAISRIGQAESIEQRAQREVKAAEEQVRVATMAKEQTDAAVAAAEQKSTRLQNQLDSKQYEIQQASIELKAAMEQLYRSETDLNSTNNQVKSEQEMLFLLRQQISKNIQRILQGIEGKTGQRSAVVHINLNENSQYIETWMITPESDYKFQQETNTKRLIQLNYIVQLEISSLSSGSRILKPLELIYTQIIEPIEDKIEIDEINNLIFILDPKLRSTPIAALYDGKKFLIEKYSVSVMPGFTLTSDRYVNLKNSSLLAAGTTRNQFSIDTLFVESELRDIQSKWSDVDLLIDNQFDRTNIEKLIPTKSIFYNPPSR